MKQGASAMSVMNKIATVFGVMIAATTLSLGAHAVPFTYSYIGNPFDEDFASGEHSVDPILNVTGEFTIEFGDPDNHDILAGNHAANVIAASFTAVGTDLTGDRTLTELNIVTFAFSTDSNGDINIDSTLNLLLSRDPLPGSFESDPLVIGIRIGGTPNFPIPADGDFTTGPDSETIAFSDEVGRFVQVSAVPEPGALALFGAGLVGFGFLRRRQREKLGQ